MLTAKKTIQSCSAVNFNRYNLSFDFLFEFFPNFYCFLTYTAANIFSIYRKIPPSPTITELMSFWNPVSSIKEKGRALAVTDSKHAQLAEFISLILVQYFIRITQMLVKYCFKILDQYIFAPEFLGSQYFFQLFLPVLVKYIVFCQ